MEVEKFIRLIIESKRRRAMHQNLLRLILISKLNEELIELKKTINEHYIQN